MATLFRVVEKYTRNQFQLSESVPLNLAPQIGAVRGVGGEGEAETGVVDTQ